MCDLKHLLGKGLFDFANPQGRDLLARCEPFGAWVEESAAEGTFQFLRHHTSPVGTHASVVGFGGQTYQGVNLASQDYLGLSRHPRVTAAAAEACLQRGTHSAGSEPMGGGMKEAKALERQLATFVEHDHVVLFPTGWAAGYGAIKGLIREHDHIVMDALAHDCLQHGARAATPNISLFSHNDLVSLEKRLQRIRRKDGDAAILVVTESLFSMDSDAPDFRRVVALCRKYGAFLLVDVAHDLGVLGPAGKGLLAEQGVLADVDFLIGSFSKTFACIGGFFASKTKATACYVRGFSGSYTFSNFLVPAQVAAVSTALSIVASPEGEELRRSTLANAARLREALASHGLPQTTGITSPIVIQPVGGEAVARLAYRACLQRGVIVNNVEFPACRRGEARFRLQVTPAHTPAQLKEAAAIVADALAEGRQMARELADSDAPLRRAA